MSINLEILNCLQKNSSVEIPGFGVFYLKNSGAVVNQEQKIILPPAKQVFFTFDPSAKDNTLQNQLVKANFCTEEQAEQEITERSASWKFKYDSKENFTLDQLGDFVNSESGFVFLGKRDKR